MDSVQFRTNSIELVKKIFPDMVVVARNQNVSQPVNVSSGEEMMDINIEIVTKVGTDFEVEIGDGLVELRGDRLVQVSFELFSPLAMDKLCEFRDRLELDYMKQFMTDREFMEQRGANPFDTTRIHGNTNWVTSAEYVTRFHTAVAYRYNRNDTGYIESVEINSNLEGQ